jgi:hypothetical protein
MAGEMRQAGNVARFTLRRTGPAEVEASPRSTPVRPELEDQWTGEYELLGYPRRVTITLENRGEAGASAKFVIVGKMTNDLPVDSSSSKAICCESNRNRHKVFFEGRIFAEAGEIRGTIEVGPVELPLVLRRSFRRTS